MSKKRHPEPLVFSTTDVFGNLVVLAQATWNEHIIDIDGHPEMAGWEQAVYDVIGDPHEVRLSTEYDTGVAFISDANVGPRPEGIRAIVGFAEKFYEKGATTGMVITAYPIDIVNYRNPRIGKTIYKKGGRK